LEFLFFRRSGVKVNRKEKERELRIKLVFEAAERVFGKKPYEEASMLEIANEAQLGMQSLYNTFKSKRELYDNLVNYRIGKFRAAMDEVFSKNDEPLEALRQWTFEHFRTFSELSAFYPVFLKERLNYVWGFESRSLPALKVAFQKEEKRLVGLLEKAQQAGHLKLLPVGQVKAIFFNLLQSKLEYHFLNHKPIEVNECVEETMNLFLNGLKA
jgi:AcrR family transcriptional regulator